MNCKFGKPGLIAVAVLLGTCGILPAQEQPVVKAPARTKPAPARKSAPAAKGAPATQHTPTRRQRPDQSKLPELNQASREELLKVPGITPALADKIIAGRPYLSKADLVVKGIIPESLYASLHRQVRVAPPSVKPAAAPKP